MCGCKSSSLNRLMAAYADSSSKCEASISETLLHGVSAGGVTLVQVFPPSRVRLMTPSSEPVQIMFRFLNEGATVYMTPRFFAREKSRGHIYRRAFIQESEHY